MALKATIFKAELQVADLDRAYYGNHALTMALHPSETEERMIVRLLAFALHAEEGLSFTKGLCVDDEPDLWLLDPTGAIVLWIEVGQPDERRIRRACGQAAQVVVYNYGGRTADIWWSRVGPALSGLKNLKILDLPSQATKDLAALARRSMSLQCTVQDGRVWLGGQESVVELDLGYRLGGRI